MKRWKWSPLKKALVVLKGLRGRPVGDLCHEHGIPLVQHSQWRDRFLGNAHLVFKTASTDKRSQRLESENARLKGLVGKLTVELDSGRTDGREIKRLLCQGGLPKS